MSKTTAQVIAKGVCSYPQTEDFVKAKQFIIIEENDKRYLLVKLSNLRPEKVTGVTLYVEQFEAGGRKISADSVRLTGLSGYPKKSFAVERKILVADECEDCKITVLEAEFGGYAFTPKNLEKPSYRIDPPAPTAPTAKAGAKGVKVAPRTLKMPVLIITVSILALLIALVAIAVQTSLFTRESDNFLQNGVRYYFVDGDKSDGSDIYVGGYKGSFESVNIPEKIDGHRVVSIEKGAFNGNGRLKTVIIRGNISVGGDAFANCVSLKSINLENVTAIGDYAFQNCISLEAVSIKRAARIGTGAFASCSGLTSVVVASGDDPVSVGAHAFSDCVSLKTVDIGRDIVYDVYGGAEAKDLFVNSRSIEELHITSFKASRDGYAYTVHGLFGLGAGDGGALNLRSLTVDELDAIGYEFCRDIPVEKVRIGYLQNTEIGDYAFYGCSELEELELNEKLTGIGEYAFSASGIKTVDASAAEYVGDCAFLNSGIENFDLKSNSVLESIGIKAFENSGLSEIYIPACVQSVAANAFAGCQRLVTVEFSERSAIASISGNLFSGSSRLASVTLPRNTVYIYGGAFSDCKALSSIELPQTLARISASAFAGAGLTTLYIPDGVESIGQGAFSDCSSLTQINVPFVGGSSGRDNYFAYIFGASSSSAQADFVPKSLKTVTVRSSSNIGDMAFYDCGNIEQIIFTGAPESIGERAFYNCSALTSIALNEGLQTIGAYAFGGCASLVSLTIPKSTVKTGEGVLYGCEALTELSVPYVGATRYSDTTLAFMFGADYGSVGEAARSLEKVSVTDTTAIGDGAFNGCYNLREVELCDTIENINSYAFAECRKLNKVTIPSSVDYIGDYAFYGCYRLYEVYNFSSRYSYVVAGDAEPGYLAYYALVVHGSSADSLTKVVSDGFEFVYNDGVWHLVGYPEGKEQLMLPSSVVADGYAFGSYEIFARLFYADFTVKEIAVPSSVTSIGAETFAYCTSLERLSLSVSVTSIGERAFFDCVNLREIELPQYLTEISDGLFESCVRLTEIKLPVSFSKIGNRAFAECKRLRAFDMPEGVTSIGDEAFYHCVALKRIVVPKSLSYCGINAFYDCIKLYDVCNLSRYTVRAGSDDLGCVAKHAYKVFTNANAALSQVIVDGVYYVETDGWHAVDYYGTDGELTVGAFTYNGVAVNSVAIDDYAFAENEVIDSARIDNAVTKIGCHAFDGCGLLKTVNIECDALVVETDAFAYANLGSVEISGGGVTLKTGAFMNCYGEFSFVCNGDAFTVEAGAFYGCGVTEISLAGKTLYASEAVFANCRNLKGITLDFDSDIAFGFGAFLGCYSLEDVTVRGGNVSINANAFYGVNTVKSLSIEGEDIVISSGAIPYAPTDGLTVSGENVRFESNAIGGGTISVVNISGADVTLAADAINAGAYNVSVVGDSSATIGTRSIGYAATAFAATASVINIADEAFANSSVGKVTLNGTVITVGKSAFSNVGASEVSISSSATVLLGESAFAYNTSLTKLELTAPTVSLGAYAFYNCALSSVVSTGQSLTVGEYAFYMCTDLSSVRLQADADSVIGRYAFYNAANMRTLVLPSSLKRIEENAFGGCASLASLELPSSVNYIGNSAFYNCGSLTSVSIPSGVGSVGDYAFTGCVSVTSITLPRGLVSVGSNAFDGCISIKSLTLPQTLKEIGDYAFSNCGSLASLEVPASVSSLGIGAFSGCNSLASLKLSAADVSASAFVSCTSLVSLDIPSGVTSIGRYAFSECRSLKTLTLPDSVTSVNEGAFYDCDALTELTLSSRLATVGEYAFYNCVSLTALDIPSGLITIGGNAFKNCASLTELSVPNSVTSIGSYAFAGCVKLKKLTVSGKLPSLGSSAFQECSALESLNMSGSSIALIGSYAFYGCSSLTELILPASLTTIQASAFSGCSSLTTLTLPQNLTSVSSNAFAGAYKLFSIYNRSGRYITAGATDYGGVASYAIAVTTDKLYQPEFARYDDIGFVKLMSEWYLYEYPAYDGSIVLPSQLTIVGETVMGYSLHKNAFKNYIDSIVIPLSVKKVASGTFTSYVNRVYYGGTAQQWNAWSDRGSGYYSNANLYFYADCIHEPGNYWMYKDGAPSVTGYALGEWTVIKAATCTEAGVRRRDCEHCDYYETETIDALGHTYENGVCVRCGEKENDPTSSYYDPKNVSSENVRIDSAAAKEQEINA